MRISEPFLELLEKDSSGSTATCIQRLKFKIIVITFPSISEQTAIADILSDMDAETAALEQSRDKTRLQKQGMMQELLTGRIRLI